jgi:hypothetical protein
LCQPTQPQRLCDPRAIGENAAMAEGTDDFYPQVPVFDGFARLTDPALYRPLPPDWVVGLSDVVASTAAIRAGRYKSVNIAGAALIAAVSNALAQRDFPFAFGGDGASFALPPGDADTAHAALAATAAWVRDDLGLALRVALVPMAAIREAGWDVRIARYAPSPHVSYAMFMGGGLAWAGREMKAGAFKVEPAAPGTRPDLSGLSCRWQEFPARHGVVLSLIATPAVAEAEAPFQELVGDLLRMTGRESESEHPLANPMRAFGWPPPGLDVEARSSRAPGESILRRKLVLGLQSLASWVIIRFGIPIGGFRPERYIGELVANADFRKYDDGLRMTLDCTPALADRLEARLLAAEQAGIAQFGLHRQEAAIVTCFTPSPFMSDHVHFVDGAAGGFAAAAARLKP